MKTYPIRTLDLDLGKYGKVKFNQWFFKEQPPVPSESWIDEFSPFIPTGSFVIDIGAFIGDTTLALSILAGPTGKVLAFEPGPASFPILLDNINLNHLANVEAVPCAVTKVTGKFQFHYTDEGLINGGFSSSLDIKPRGCGNTYPVEVAGVELRGYLENNYASWLSKLSFVKIDTEGYDKEILKANAPFFRKFRPVVQVEVYPFLSARERHDLMNAIREIGYSWFGDEQVFLRPNPKASDVICKPT